MECCRVFQMIRFSITMIILSLRCKCGVIEDDGISRSNKTFRFIPSTTCSGRGFALLIALSEKGRSLSFYLYHRGFWNRLDFHVFLLLPIYGPIIVV
jgi:hypothetical protein